MVVVVANDLFEFEASDDEAEDEWLSRLLLLLVSRLLLCIFVGVVVAILVEILEACWLFILLLLGELELFVLSAEDKFLLFKLTK